jgi:hypothetical protein
MAFSAIIISVSAVSERINVGARFSTGEERLYVFDGPVTRAQIKDRIKEDVRFLDDVEKKAATLQDLIGLEIS